MAESEHSEESPQPEASIVNSVLSWKEEVSQLSDSHLKLTPAGFQVFFLFALVSSKQVAFFCVF